MYIVIVIVTLTSDSEHDQFKVRDEGGEEDDLCRERRGLGHIMTNSGLHISNIPFYFFNERKLR